MKRNLKRMALKLALLFVLPFAAINCTMMVQPAEPYYSSPSPRRLW